MMNPHGRGGVLEARDQARAGRWRSAASAMRCCSACQQPVAVVVTFYQFVRDALLQLMGVAATAP